MSMKERSRILAIAVISMIASISPSAGRLRTPERKEDAPAVETPQDQWDKDNVLDEKYEMEPFYQGLAIFNADGTRAPHLMPGDDYVMTQIMVGANPVACWRARGPQWDSRTGLENPEALEAANKKALAQTKPPEKVKR